MAKGWFSKKMQYLNPSIGELKHHFREIVANVRLVPPAKLEFGSQDFREN